MEISDFINIVFLLKQMDKLGMRDRINKVFGMDSLFYDGLDYDIVCNLADFGMFEIFASCDVYGHEDSGREYYVYKDEVITRFFTLAGEYGRKFGLTDNENLYIANIYSFARDTFNFSYSLSWVIRSFTEEEKARYSEFAIVMYEGEDVDTTALAISLAKMYLYFSEQSKIIEKCLNPAAVQA